MCVWERESVKQCLHARYCGLECLTRSQLAVSPISLLGRADERGTLVINESTCAARWDSPHRVCVCVCVSMRHWKCSRFVSIYFYIFIHAALKEKSTILHPDVCYSVCNGCLITTYKSVIAFLYGEKNWKKLLFSPISCAIDGYGAGVGTVLVVVLIRIEPCKSTYRLFRKWKKSREPWGRDLTQTWREDVNDATTTMLHDLCKWPIVHLHNLCTSSQKVEMKLSGFFFLFLL